MFRVSSNLIIDIFSKDVNIKEILLHYMDC